jgi:hypothetical protein
MKLRRPRRYARNPDAVSTTGLSTAQTVGIVAAGAAAVGIVGYFIWKSQQQSAATPVPLVNTFNSPGTAPPGAISLSSELTEPAGYMPTPPLPALPAGYNWWNQGNTKVPSVGDSVDVVVQGGSFGTSASHPGMPGPDGQAVTGTVVSLGTVGPTTAIGTVTMRVTPYAGMPLFPTPQLLTFPLEYVVDTSGNFATPGG